MQIVTMSGEFGEEMSCESPAIFVHNVNVCYVFNVKMFLRIPFKLAILLSTDVNECTEMMGRCGLGTCVNDENAMFYDCLCEDGAMRMGESSQGTLTCVGQ